VKEILFDRRNLSPTLFFTMSTNFIIFVTRLLDNANLSTIYLTPGLQRGESMESTIYPQCRIVPIQMLKAKNAEKFLDGLSYIAGIRRVLVHGPGYQKNGIENPCIPCTRSLPSSTLVTISNQPMQMHVLLGDVIVETADEQVIEKVAKYCDEFFDDIAYQILVGTFMKTQASQSDYIRPGVVMDTDLIGLSDTKQSIFPYILPVDNPSQCET
jgi:methyl-coenzyme M reductase subunit D